MHLLADNHKADLLTVAVIAVCVASDVTEKIASFIRDIPWSVTTATLDSYISGGRRPSFGARLTFANACIAIVDFDDDSEAAAETTKYLRQIFPARLTIVGLGTSTGPALLLLAMRAGCSEFLHKPLDSAGVEEMLERIRISWLSSVTRPASSGSIFSLFGTKGGVGTTTLAAHLAVYLARNHQKRTLLIDFHAELGHVCVYLGIDGTQCNFQEVVKNVNRLDSELLHRLVARHPSGIDILSSPDTCYGAKPLEIEAVEEVIQFLIKEYDYIIFDCTTSLSDVDLAVLSASTTVYLVATPEVGAIRDLSRYVDKLQQIEGLAEKIGIVANRFPAPHTVNLEQMEKAVRMPIEIKFPASYAELMQAGNLGETVATNSKSEFSVNMTKWAATLTGSVPSLRVSKGIRQRFMLRK